MPDSGPPDVVLGFDFGMRRIGVAVGSGVSGSAQALTTLHHSGDGPDWAAVRRLVGEWRPQALVVGLPLLESGEEQPITGHARWFMRELGAQFNLPIHQADERFTSTEALARLRTERASGARRKRLSKGDTDAMAAQIILETWLISHRDG
ncbi:MAG: Holliday junction resolvase RuvX [Salinisphaeraceae bacterium]|nr:Holliday junction resolvase RuvX [Salinisphaeraceae bacterium]